jgi:hypothetical protein
VSGPARELALEMNRIVIANGESDADGASGLDAAGRLHDIVIPAIVACGELDVSMKIRRSAELADALPNATYRSLPGRAHLPYLADVLVEAIPKHLVCGDAITPGIWAQPGTRGSRTVRMKAIDRRSGRVWWRKKARARTTGWRNWYLTSGWRGWCRRTTIVYSGPGFIVRYNVSFKSEGV